MNYKSIHNHSLTHVDQIKRHFCFFLGITGFVGTTTSFISILVLRFAPLSIGFHTVLLIISTLIVIFSRKKSVNTDFITTITILYIFFSIIYIVFFLYTDFFISLSFLSFFPLIAIFLLGKKNSIPWLIVYLGVIIALIGLQSTDKNITTNSIGTICIALVLKSVITLFYIYTVEKAQNHAQERNKTLIQTAEQLQHEFIQREETQKKLTQSIKELDQQKQELERINTIFIERELKMAKIKQQINKLKNVRQSS